MDGLIEQIPIRSTRPLARLYEVLFEHTSFHEFAKTITDPRLSDEHWSSVLRHELMALFRWCLEKQDGGSHTHCRTFDYGHSVLCLLPYYGFCLHAIRRAIPFAMMGIPTTISVRQDVFKSARRLISDLAILLDLEDMIFVSSKTSESLVSTFHEKECLIVLTGKRSTYQLIREQYPNARIIAATGCCEVVICSDEEEGRVIEEYRKAEILPTSCSNHACTIFAHTIDAHSQIIAINGVRLNTVMTVGDALEKLHPSIILTPQLASSYPSELAGYTLLACAKNSSLNHGGFAKDPIGGWPGDYKI